MRTFILLFLLSFILQSCSNRQNSGQRDMSFAKTLLLMEDEMQLFAESEFYRGSSYYMDLKDELIAIKSRDECRNLMGKYVFLLHEMDEIDIRTDDVISYLDDLKIQLLEEDATNAGTYKVNRKNKAQPDRIILYGLKNPLAKSEIVDSIDLFRRVQKYYDTLISSCTNYTFNGKSYSFSNFPKIQSYSSRRDIFDVYKNVLSVETVNPEDVHMAADIGADSRITLEKIVGARSKTLIENLSLLTVIQKDILSQRVRAISHWRFKVGFCSF